ncbi:hypothetical protein, partial [Enterococcus faecium]|uniref:hypothetical protein n=1 Tax=Enterococcus faecium TaxID=1352 RepID=UPI003AAF5AA0
MREIRAGQPLSEKRGRASTRRNGKLPSRPFADRVLRKDRGQAKEARMQAALPLARYTVFATEDL